jgi:hypothetical protein
MAEDARVIACGAADSPGPQSANEARWFYEGFLAGVTAYAAAAGHSGLKRDNPTLAKLIDDRAWETIGLFERFGDGGDPPRPAAGNGRIVAGEPEDGPPAH